MKLVYWRILSCLSGSSTLFPGFADRVREQVSKLAPSLLQTKVHVPPDRKYSSWIRGSILASKPIFNRICINKDDYDEYGPALIYRKCV